MNRLFFTVVLLLMLIMPQAWGATNSPYPNPNRQTAWNNITDGVHTFGQNPQQAKATLTKLHYARRKNRLKSIKLANAAKIKAKRQAWLNSQ
jgi:hypothetical protein